MDYDTRETADDRHESEAVVNARNRIALIAQSYGTNHPEYATCLNQLALLMIMQGDPDAAEPLLRQALELRRETLGALHPDFATNLSSLGGLLWARGDLDQAEPLLRQALEVRTETLGPGHPKSVVSLNSLEQLLKARRDWVGPTAPRPTPVKAESISVPPIPDEPPAAVPDEAADSPPVRVVEAPSLAPPAVLVSERPIETGPPPGDAEVDRLAAGLEGLTREFAGLGDRLEQAAGRIKAGFVPDPDAISGLISATTGDFERLRREAGELARAYSVALPGDGPAGLADLAGLLPLLREAVSVGAKREEVRRGALRVLDGVERLGCAGDPAFVPLTACRDQAKALRRSITEAPAGELPDEAHRLTAGVHPLNHLLKLVAAGDADNDAQWADWFDSVADAYGNSLAVSAARSRISASGS